jgi:hypothetical protein
MIPASVEAFRTEAHRLARRGFPSSEWRVQEQNRFRLKAHILLSPELFIDIFYSPRTRRIGFALIKGAERVFGIDNLNGWHRHPFGKVEQHEAIEEPDLAGIFSELKEVVTEEHLLTEESPSPRPERG